MGDLPSGTVTFLFSDVEGSTRLWDEAPEAMRLSLVRHDEIVRSAIERRGGYVFATGGDGFAAAFPSVADGVEAAQEIQAGLGREPWDESTPIKVRVGLHVGEVEERDGDYFGPAVNRAARIMAAGHGGQIVVSTAIVEIAGVDQFRSLGHHRLQGFGAPDELWQLGSGEFPPLRSRRREGNLPTPASSFVGRAAEVANLAEMLEAGRMITLVGVGGVGKTRLALEAARRVAGGFTDGAWFVDLAPRRDADGVAEATASALGVLPEPGQQMRQAVINYLSERRALLLLDNCEHVLDGAAMLSEDILHDAHGVTVLATSREPVGIPGERVWPMPSLRQATELFVERATDADAGFTPSADERGLIETICHRLDGIPLAIELAAARTRTMTVADILERLNDRFRLLRGSGRGGVERHQTLQATVQWSYDLLDETEQRLFEHLSVFPAGFDSTAALAICGPMLTLDEWELRDALDRLVERSLVVAGRDDHLTRYRLLETFRQFGEQRLDLDTATSLHRAHLVYFVEVAWEAGVGYIDRVDDPDPDPWLVERDNIRAAMEWALADHDVDACERLGRAFAERNMIQLDLDYEELLLEAASLPSARGVTVAFAANMAGYGARGDFRAGLELARRAVELDPGEPWTWFALGTQLVMTQGPSAEATSTMERAVKLAAPEHRSFRALLHGMSAAAAGDVDPALAAAHISQVEELLRAGLSPRGQALANAALARAVLSNGDLDRALTLCERTLESSIDDPRSRLRLGAYALRAEALALKPGADATWAFREALAPAIELAWWGQIWRYLLPLARWWSMTGNASAAALFVGWAKANDITVAGLDQLAADLSDPSLQVAHQQGASMSRTELLEYVMAELAPVATAGALTT